MNARPEDLAALARAARERRVEERFMLRLVELRAAAIGNGLTLPAALMAASAFFATLLEDTAAQQHGAARESFDWVFRRGFDALGRTAEGADMAALGDMAADLDAFLWDAGKETEESRAARRELAAHESEQAKLEAAAAAETTALLTAQARDRRRKLSAFQAWEEE